MNRSQRDSTTRSDVCMLASRCQLELLLYKCSHMCLCWWPLDTLRGLLENACHHVSGFPHLHNARFNQACQGLLGGAPERSIAALFCKPTDTAGVTLRLKFSTPTVLRCRQPVRSIDTCNHLALQLKLIRACSSIAPTQSYPLCPIRIQLQLYTVPAPLRHKDATICASVEDSGIATKRTP